MCRSRKGLGLGVKRMLVARTDKVLHHGDGIVVCTTAADMGYVDQPGCAADLLKRGVHLRKLGS